MAVQEVVGEGVAVTWAVAVTEEEGGGGGGRATKVANQEESISKNKCSVRCAAIASGRKRHRFCVPYVPYILTPVATPTRIPVI